MDDSNPGQPEYDPPIRLGVGELATPGAGYVRRDAWTLFLREAVKWKPEFLQDLFKEEAFAIAARYPDGQRPWSPWMEPDHEMWAYVRQWCKDWGFGEEAAFDELAERAENTIYRAYSARQKGEPLPSAFSEPPSIAVTTIAISEDGTIQPGRATILKPRFLKPTVASHLFLYDCFANRRGQYLQRVMKEIRADIEVELDRVEAEAREQGAITAPTKMGRQHFEWTVRVLLLHETYTSIAQSQASTRAHRKDDEAEAKIYTSAVSRSVKEVCDLLGIARPVRTAGRPRRSISF